MEGAVSVLCVGVRDFMRMELYTLVLESSFLPIFTGFCGAGSRAQGL
jgi:hypothetical protein